MKGPNSGNMLAKPEDKRKEDNTSFTMEIDNYQFNRMSKEMELNTVQRNSCITQI